MNNYLRGGVQAGWATLFSFGVAGVPLLAQASNLPTAVGDSFKINSPTDFADPNNSPDVARSASGGFVVAWAGTESADTNYSIYVRRFSKGGAALGSEFIANAAPSTATMTISKPKVAIADDGGFVVVWQDENRDPSNGNTSIVYKGRLFAANGTPRMNEFCLDPVCTSEDDSGIDGKTVAMDAAGNFVVSWIDFGTTSTDASIKARRFSSDGSALDAAPMTVASGFHLGNLGSTLPRGLTSTRNRKSGDFVIAWQKIHGYSVLLLLAGTNETIEAQRYSAAGKVVGRPLLVNSCSSLYSYSIIAGCTMSTANLPQLTMTGDDAGNLIFAWTQTGKQDGSKLYARRFTSAGRAAGAKFSVASLGRLGGTLSTAQDDAGDFVTAWDDASVVLGQSVSASDSVLASNLQISPADKTTLGGAVAADSDGNLTAVWVEYTATGENSATGTVVGQLYKFP